MNVLLVGCGKMGRLTCHVLQKHPEVQTLSVCDNAFDVPFCRNGVAFYPALDSVDLRQIDAAFISTPAKTHGAVMEKLLRGGVKNFFVEKPAVLTRREYDALLPLLQNRRTVTGYILRQSEAAHSCLARMKAFAGEGYALKSCRVVYQKYLPAGAEERTKDDMGVFDEVVHIWDMLFGYLGLDGKSAEATENTLSFDPLMPSRIIRAKLGYRIRETDLEIFSSFAEKEKKREFVFVFSAPEKEERILTLSFDRDDDTDALVLTDADGNELAAESYPALTKLDRQISHTFSFFAGGERGELADFLSSELVISFLEKVGQPTLV